MKKQIFRIQTSGFNGVWYPCKENTDAGVIVMLGDSSEDTMAKAGAKWLHSMGFHVMAMSPDKKDYGHHSYPLERFGLAIAFMKAHGCEKIGIAGASTTGMLALTAASYYPDITLTIAVSPPDFIMEGFYRDGKDGMEERPGDFESSVTWQGKQLPFLPYAYRHPRYWQEIRRYSKETSNMIASREMFDESERLHPLQEEEKIKVERIRGKIVFVGAEDDCLWDTCKYIRRMEERLKEKEHTCTYESLLYEHGTHFAFPQSLIRRILPFGEQLFVSAFFKAGRQYPKECTETRKDIDVNLNRILAQWKEADR